MARARLAVSILCLNSGLGREEGKKERHTTSVQHARPPFSEGLLQAEASKAEVVKMPIWGDGEVSRFWIL